MASDRNVITDGAGHFAVDSIDTGAYMTNRLSVLRIDADGATLLEPAS